MKTKRNFNLFNLLAVLVLLAGVIWPAVQASAQLPTGGYGGDWMELGGQAGPARQSQPGRPVDPRLTALEPQKTAAGESAPAASAPAANFPLAYDYQYEWTGSQAITDNSCSGTHQYLTLNVPDSFNVNAVHVGFNAAHTWRDDVQLWVISPQGARVQLLDGANGGSADNFDVLFQPGGSTTYTANHTITSPYYENIWAPQGGDLAGFFAQAAQGNWQIEVCDDTAYDTGTVYRWALWFEAIDPGLYLSPGAIQVSGCNGVARTHTLSLFNLTGAAGVFSLAYQIDAAYGSLSGPASLSLANGAGANFDVTLQPEVCLPEGVSINASVTASGNSLSATSNITQTISTQGQWDAKAAMSPGGLYDHAVVDGGNGSLYAMGGNGQGTQLNLRYNTATDAWTQVTSLPGDLRIIDGGQVAGVIYLPGGFNGSSFVATTYAYNVAGNSWTTVASAPRSVAAYGAAACDGKLYRLGGASYSTFPNGETGAEVYDPTTNAWTSLAPMTGGHTWPAVACIDHKLYVAGGVDAAGSDSTLAEVYDIATNTWSDAAMADLPITRWGSADFAFDGEMYLAGGIVNGASSASVLAYSPATDAWHEAASLSQARFRLEGDSAYATGGMEPTWTQHAEHELFAQCPSCTQSGTLAGKVFDYDGVNPPENPAAVTIQPGNYQASVDASGNYSIALPPFTYQATASAEGYPQVDGPHTVQVTDGATTAQDFTLPRPDIEVQPTILTATLTAPGTASRTFDISNLGTLALDFSILERTSTSVLGAGASGASPAVQDDAQIEVEPQLSAQMALDEKTGYLVYFDEKPDLAPAEGMTWNERGAWAVEQLQATAARSQARVRAYLDAQKADYKAYWIDNVIVVNASSRAVFQGLQSYTEIAALRARRHPFFYKPESINRLLEAAPMLVQSNLTHVGADQTWAQGFTGQGIVVANIDTGVNYTHEALVQQYRGNLGGGSFNHNHNWYDPASGGTHLLAPADHDDHGSHTMGTMVGSTDPAHPDAASSTIGMAPGAKWIACRAFEASDQELLDCGQFLAAPTELDGVTNPDASLRPHIINNSWGDCTTTYDSWYDGVITSWHALGIYPVFSNGNASNCGYSSPPGLNTVGSPARAGNVTGVGATGRSDGQYATFSNWGPTDQSDTINPMGYPRLKPQVVAPGTNYSSGSTSNSYLDMSGTSMAAPHVAGLIALMWSAAPCLVGDYAQTETILQQTANPVPYDSGGTPAPGPGNVPNYATGWGEIDADAAVSAAESHCNTDWLSWVTVSPISGTIGSNLSQAIQVDFTCTLTDSLQAQPLTGVLHVTHNDPTRGPVDVNVQMSCYSTVPSYALNVFKSGAGSGTVTSNPPGIDCGSTCSHDFTAGTVVTLTASVATGSTFAGWSGACTGSGSCVVTMDAAKDVTAAFNQIEYKLYLPLITKLPAASRSAPAGARGMDAPLGLALPAVGSKPITE